MSNRVTAETALLYNRGPMDARARWDEAKRLFDVAVDLAPAERDDFLARTCQRDATLRTEVQSLLAWADASHSFLEEPIIRLADFAPVPGPADAMLGQSLGPWRIVDIIGRGGMGVVYRAERADAAFRRVVAIKVVGRGSVAADVIERFHRERETLARLDHPNIARLIDGGSTPDGQPYFVMEFVEGLRIDAYCDEHQLTVGKRLALFRTICAAVRYAHYALVVHRDLKPDNILVSHDGVPKLLDFGIARMLSDASGSDDRPEAATWMLTPDFASPEQMAGLAVTTATDVYSLGVLLHVLLTGRTPYRLLPGSQAELRSQLASTTIEPPSRTVRAATPESDARARARRSTPRHLSARLSGDLDAIVMRALEQDPRKRYGSVEQLLDELNRHRAQQPVTARGDHWAYRTGVFLRRNHVSLALGVAFLLVILTGITAVLQQAALTADARARAERRLNDVRQLANVFMFDVHDEIVNVPGTTRARELMVRTASKYLEGLARESTGDLGLQRELADAFVKVGDAEGHPTSANIGDTAAARVSYERAIALANTILAVAPDDLDTERLRAMAHRRLADVLAWSGRLDEALQHCELSLRLFADVAARGTSVTTDQLQLAIAEIKLGDLLGNPNLLNLQRPDEATIRYDVALRSLRTLTAGDPHEPQVRRYLALILERIGTLHEQAGNTAGAQAAYLESFALRDKLAGDAPLHNDIQRDLAIAYEKLANVSLAHGDRGAAEAHYRGALAQFERLAESDRSNVVAVRSVAISREKLATTLLGPARAAEAISLLRGALDAHKWLAAHDPENAQSPCDATRVEEALGDAWAQQDESPARAACGFWRASLARMRQLRTDAHACVTSDDISRMSAKLTKCR